MNRKKTFNKNIKTVSTQSTLPFVCSAVGGPAEILGCFHRLVELNYKSQVIYTNPEADCVKKWSG